MTVSIKNKKELKVKLGWIVQIFILFICIFSFYLSNKVFVIPIFGDIYKEQSQISEIDKELYDILSKVDADGRAWYLAVEKKEQELKLKMEEADKLYESIRPTEVIKKGVGSNMRSVGKYAKVEDMRKAIGDARIKLDSEKKQIAALRGGLVDYVEVKDLWKQRLPLMKEVNEYQRRKSEYLSSQKGSRTSFYKDIFFVIGLISALLSVFLVAYRISS